MQKTILGVLCLLAGAGAAGADAADDAAKAAFQAGFAGGCDAEMIAPDSILGPVQRHDLSMPQTGTDPAPVSIWIFPCMMGAYNLSSVVYIKDDFWGLHPVAFAQPEIAVTYTVPDDSESAVKDIAVTGWIASPFLTNAVFDPQTLTMTNQSLWRGIGDASEGGSWQLVDGGFRLTGFAVDASYDQAVNPAAVYPAP